MSMILTFLGLFSLLSVAAVSHAQAPLVTLQSPTPDAQLKGSVAFSARSSDPAANMAVQWCVDSTPLPGPTIRNGADYISALVDTSKFIDGPHTVRVSARIASGATMVSAPVMVAVDNRVAEPPPPPPAPTELVATVVSASQIDLVWKAPSLAGVTGYRVYRDGSLVETVTGLSTSMLCLFPATAYSLSVVALYGPDVVSNHSTPISATTKGDTTADTAPPSVPTQVHAVVLTFNQVEVLWSASTDNVAIASYQITQDGKLIGTSAGMRFLVTGLAPSTSYAFSVMAIDTSGNVSGSSSSVSATTLPIPPTAGQPVSFKMHHDNIPNFAKNFTIKSEKNGLWSDVSSWSGARVPGATDIVLVTHAISYDSMIGDVDTVGIDVGGVFSFQAATPTKLLLKTLLVMPQGVLQVGTVQGPIMATAEIVIKDAPINTVTDPTQYGHGILAINGTVTMHGAKKEPTFLRLAAEPKAGENSLTLTGTPIGWQVGDRLVVPDTRQLTRADIEGFDEVNNIRRLVSQSEVVTIQTISGASVTLAAPLKFDHLGARDAAGKLDFLPHVGNLSRSIVVRSANPAGVRGHTLFTGVSTIDVRYTAFQNLGRTLAEPLNNTTFDSEGVATRIGTNQIGRYPVHNHHNYGPCADLKYQFSYVGNSIEESGRWGMTIHGSHYGLIQDNVIYNVKGAGFATEDGSETENVFEHNFIVKVENKTQLTVQEAGGNVDPLGRKGNSFWFRGVGSILRNNVMADTREGVGIYTGSEEGDHPDSPNIPVNIPTHRCAQTTIAGQFRTIEPLWTVPNREFFNNEIYSTSEFGISTWVNPGFGAPFRDTTIWHAHNQVIFMKYTDPTFDGLVIRNKGGTGTAIQQFNNFGGGGNIAATIKRADVQGVDVIYRRGGQIGLAPNYTIADSYFVSRNGFFLDANGQGLDASKWSFNNVKFGVLPGAPLKTISTVFNKDGGDRGNARHEIFVTSYQGNPLDNFKVYFTVQDPRTIAYHLDEDFGMGAVLQGCPVAGLTNQQCWDQHKVATFGELAPCTDTETHPEIGGFSCNR